MHKIRLPFNILYVCIYSLGSPAGGGAVTGGSVVVSSFSVNITNGN